MVDISMVEIATGHVSNRSQVAMSSDISKYVFPPIQKTETYHSWYRFDEQLTQHINNKGSIQGFNGVYYIDTILLDYDRKNLDDNSLYEAIRWLVSTEMIEDLGIKRDHIIIWFSGTGFHIEIPNLFGFKPSNNLPSIVKETLVSIFPDCDPIYDGARLIRAGFSYNPKEGNFKVPFSFDDFVTTDMQTIKALSASHLRKNENKDANYWEKGFKWIHAVRKDWESCEPYLFEYIKYPEMSVTNVTRTVRTAFKTDPNSIVSCMQSVLRTAPPIGERNETMMRLGSWLRRAGVPQPIVADVISKWSGLPREAEVTVAKLFDNKYEYSCQDYVMAKHCKPNCIYFKHKDYSLPIMNAEDMASEFSQFIKTDFSKSAFNFKDIYNIPKDHWVYPGELVVVSGDTGLGKSTFVMNLVAKLPKMHTLFLSLENHKHLTYRRFVQITHSLSKYEVIKQERESEEKLNFYQAFKHIHVLCVPPELNKLTETIARIKPRIVVVDTTDEIFVKGVYSEIEKMNAIISGLKAVAESQECIIIAVHHINKDSMNQGITTKTSLKGTTNVIQKADKVYLLNGSMKEKQRMVHSAKARDESPIRIMFNMNMKTMQFEEIHSSEGFEGV